MIALLDYGAGNLTSVRKGLMAVGARLFTPADPASLRLATALVVPGVGHFEALKALDGRWRDAIRDVVDRGTPLLGICLGLQWLFEGSFEAPDVAGLEYFPGLCERLPPPLKVPHVGWNSLDFARGHPLMDGIVPGAQVYFTHSYAAPVVAGTAASTTYGVPFSAAVQRGRVTGLQFHPEKSGDVGLRVLRNWLASVEPCSSLERSCTQLGDSRNTAR